MPTKGNGNGKDNRLSFLGTSSISSNWKRYTGPTSDEARALIDKVFRNYGLDPLKATDPSGWRHLSLGLARGAAGVVEWQPGIYYLVVFAPVLDLPEGDPSHLLGLYKLLLELNHDGTLAARFSIQNNVVYVGLTRPIRGLDQEEVDAAIRAVMTVADSYDEWLQAVLDASLGTASVPIQELPKVKLLPQEVLRVGAVLSACDPHGREVFGYLMEQWQKAGYVIDSTATGIGLKIPLGSYLYSLASMRPGVGERRQLVIIGWEGLRKQKAFAADAIDRFQSAVMKIADIKVTESTGHIEVTEDFNQNCAKALWQAMRTLAQAAHPELVEEEPLVWDTSLPSINITVGSTTLAGIQETLRACEPPVQQMYVVLIEGWGKAGGTVQCTRPGRIYLKLQTGEHEFGKYGRVAHKLNLAVLAAPKGKRGPSIDLAWNLAVGDYESPAYLNHAADAVARFEAVIAKLPGFEQQGVVTRLIIDEAFQSQHAQTLLEAMLVLKEAEEKAR